MKLCRIAICFLMLLLVPSVAFAKYVAVLETTVAPAAKDIVSASDRTYMTDVLRGEAVKVLPAEQNYTIMTRENINVMLPPGKSIEDCEGSCLAETGKNIAADYVAQAKVGMFGGTLTLNVEIYETAGNKLVASFNGEGQNVQELLAIIKSDAPSFFKKVKGSSSFDGFSGVGAVSGGSEFSFQGTQKFIVEIVTNPAGALPTVDGKGFQKCTSTPCKVQLEAGEHRFVASMERYDDAESVVNVTGNYQKVVLNLNPNFGILNLRPQLPGSVGNRKKLKMTIDGKPAQYGKNELDPGVHSVRITHPCYDPAEFPVSIGKNKTETFDAPLNRGIGGLELDAEWKGEPQVVPVYFDGKEVGSTPFAGEVPMCSKVYVGPPSDREEVAVKLKWHEVVNVSHNLKKKPVSVALADEDLQRSKSDEIRERAQAAYDEIDGKNGNSRAGESVPSNIETEPSGVNWLLVGVSTAVTVTGTVLAIVGNSKAKSASEKDITSKDDYEKYKAEAHDGQTLRTVGIITAIVGAIGVGVSFAF